MESRKKETELKEEAPARAQRERGDVKPPLRKQLDRPPSILKQHSRLDGRPAQKRQLSWGDDAGGTIVEVHYREQLHYSTHSRDKEVVRRQRLRNGCLTDDADADELSTEHRHRCCLIS